MNFYNKKHDVLVIDKNIHRVQEIMNEETRAVVADAADKKTLETLAITGVVPNQLNMIPTGKYVLKDEEILILLEPHDKLNLLRKNE